MHGLEFQWHETSAVQNVFLFEILATVLMDFLSLDFNLLQGEETESLV